MQTFMVIFGILIMILGIYMFFSYRKMKNMPLAADHQKILTLTDGNFQTQLKNRLVMVDFWASWCVPCRMMAPVLNDVAEEISGKNFIAKVDIQQFPQLAQKYQIRSIPTMVLFKDGTEIGRFSGVKNKDFLVKKFQTVENES